MFQSGFQNSNRRCACSRSSPQKQNKENWQVTFDCDRIFGKSTSPAPRYDHGDGGSNSCEFCPIRKMCDDILKDIERWKCKRKKKKIQVEKCPPPIQREESIPDDVKELYKCAGISSDPKKVDSDYPLCDDFVRILKCLANSPSPKKMERKKSTDLCSYVCDYHALDLERGSSLELCNPNASRNTKGDKGTGDKDKNTTEIDDSKSKHKDDAKKNKKKKSDNDKSKEKNKSKDRSDSDNDFDKENKGKKEKNKGDVDKNKNKDKDRNRKDKDEDDDERLKGGGKNADKDDIKPTKKPLKPSPKRVEPSDRQKGGAQKPVREKQKDDSGEKKAGKAKRCDHKRDKSGKECDVELNKAVGRKITDNMRLRLEQLDLKRMNQDRCMQVPICDPCLICPPCEVVPPCNPCGY